MDFRQLTYFIEVANQKSFTKAAKKIHISQPALSKSIQGIEEEIGADLFIREPGTLLLTETGHLFLADVTELITHFNLITQKYGSTSRASFVISCVPFLGYIFADKIIDYFHEKNPNIPLVFFETPAIQLEDNTFSLDTDLSLCLICGSNIEIPEKFRMETIYKGQFVALVPQNIDTQHLFLEELPLKNYNFVTINELFKVAGKSLADIAASVFYTDHADFILNKFLSSQAIAILPDFAINFFNDQAAVLDFITPIEYEIAFIYRKNALFSSEIQALKRFFMSHFSKLTP